MAQKYRVYLCDICKGDGEVKLAKGLYFSIEVGQTFSACVKHLKEVKGYTKEDDSGLSVDEEFEYPGDVDGDFFLV